MSPQHRSFWTCSLEFQTRQTSARISSGTSRSQDTISPLTRDDRCGCRPYPYTQLIRHYSTSYKKTEALLRMNLYSRKNIFFCFMNGATDFVSVVVPSDSLATWKMIIGPIASGKRAIHWRKRVIVIDRTALDAKSRDRPT